MNTTLPTETTQITENLRLARTLVEQYDEMWKAPIQAWKDASVGNSKDKFLEFVSTFLEEQTSPLLPSQVFEYLLRSFPDKVPADEVDKNMLKALLQPNERFDPSLFRIVFHRLYFSHLQADLRMFVTRFSQAEGVCAAVRLLIAEMELSKAETAIFLKRFPLWSQENPGRTETADSDENHTHRSPEELAAKIIMRSINHPVPGVDLRRFLGPARALIDVVGVLDEYSVRMQLEAIDWCAKKFNTSFDELWNGYMETPRSTRDLEVQEKMMTEALQQGDRHPARHVAIEWLTAPKK